MAALDAKRSEVEDLSFEDLRTRVKESPGSEAWPESEDAIKARWTKQGNGLLTNITKHYILFFVTQKYTYLRATQAKESVLLQSLFPSRPFYTFLCSYYERIVKANAKDSLAELLKPPESLVSKRRHSWGNNFICRFMLVLCTFAGELGVFERPDRARMDAKKGGVAAQAAKDPWVQLMRKCFDPKVTFILRDTFDSLFPPNTPAENRTPFAWMDMEESTGYIGAVPEVQNEYATTALFLGLFSLFSASESADDELEDELQEELREV